MEKSLPLSLCGTISMTRVNDQTDVGIYGTVLYPLFAYFAVI